MVPITNTKIESLDPAWARFVGFSLLFDNPGSSLHRVGDTEMVRCQVDTCPELALYRELSRAVREFTQSESEEFGLCLLPPSSYHVTFFDGGNQANGAGANPAVRSSLIDLIDGLPGAWSESHDLVKPAAKVASELTPFLPVSFRFSHLKNWNNEVLVAALQASDEASASRVVDLTEERAPLSSFYQKTFGFGAGIRYSPHISLAYFANQLCGENASLKMGVLDASLRERTAGHEICFQSISAYAFTDMATFFRSRPHI